ncbi:uncharacterized protein LOC141667310 isoform X2 [Apium graveolens]|uniref:uncharacterized protein LOC141667310 isoform X2 n=1 Tax=Apium graveolens TaxID=4045 RepID=UPI003D7A8964
MPDAKHEVTDVMRSFVCVKNDPSEGFGVEKWEAMSLGHKYKRESLFDCEEEEEELKVVLKFKEKTFSSWDEDIVRLIFRRESEILDDYVKELVESHDLDATTKIKDMILGDSKLAASLKLLAFERLFEILVEDDVNEFTKGSAACILGFANFDECGVDIKENATKVLVKLMSDDRDTISIPVLRTLTRLAYFSSDYANFITENGALEGTLAVFEHKPSFKKIQNLAKFLVVVVHQVQVPTYKVGAVVKILDTILEIGRAYPRCIVRACYTLSYIAVERWVNEGNILNNIIDLIWNYNVMVSSSALRVAANVVKSKNSREILTKSHMFLKYLGGCRICRKPKKFQKEACYIISNIAAYGGSVKDLERYGLIDALSELLEVDDFDVRTEAACTIRNIISTCHRKAAI